LIRKLFAGASVLAIAVVAVMLVGLGSSSKSADAHVVSITGPSTIDNSMSEFQVRIDATNGHGDVFIGASDGHFSWDGNDCEYADGITDCNVVQDSGGVGDIAQFLIVDDDCGNCNVNSIFIDYTPPQGFSGGSIDIFACQEDQDDIYDDFPNVDCPNGIRKTIQVVGAVSSVTLYALRDYTNDGDVDLCTGSTVYVIAGLEYTDNVWDTSDFNNHRAIICAEVRDSVGHPVDNANVFFSNTAPGCITGPNPNNTNGNGVAHTRFEHCDDGNSGEVSTITGCVASVCGSVMVEFGGDPAECQIVVDPHDLDIGDVGNIHVLWIDELGNKVPDGVTSYFSMAHSGESSSNAFIVDSPENTVNSIAEGSAITGFAGESTVAAHAVASDRPDVVCGEHLVFTGDVHQHPDECIVDGVEDPDFVLYGNIPPGGNFEWGTFAFCGGTFATLVEISECDPDTAIFWYNTPAGGWESYVPGADVAAVNAAILARFPDEHAGIPRGTIFTAACSAIDEA
jgi:hypothetical protein